MEIIWFGDEAGFIVGNSVFSTFVVCTHVHVNDAVAERGAAVHVEVVAPLTGMWVVTRSRPR